MQKNNIWFIAIAAILGFWWGLSYAAGTGNVQAQERAEGRALFQEVLGYLHKYYVEEPVSDSLYYSAIDGVVKGLGDPHTTLFSPEEYEDFQVHATGNFAGIGVQIDMRNQWVTVMAVLPGTAAERAGLKAGDRVVEVDGESAEGWSLEQAVSRLRGEEGTAVEIGVARPGTDGIVELQVVRQKVHINSVGAAYMITPEIGYVDFRSFRRGGAAELMESIRALEAQGMEKLVLDMRLNPGGILDESIDIAGMFVKKGAEVAEVRSRVPGESATLRNRIEPVFPDIPMTVLVGSQSASAAEIVAGALQDQDRALIVGERTFGKGSVQSLFQLSGENYLKLTTATWHTPSGRSIQRLDGRRELAPLTQFEADARQDDEGADSQVPPDTFYTEMGRVVLGGGGVLPDLVVEDSMTIAEEAFVKTIYPEWAEFTSAVQNFAISYRDSRASVERGFEITDTQMSSFYEQIQRRGIEVDRGLFDAASDWIRGQLGAEIALAKWGTGGVRRYLNRKDPQVKAAIEALTRSSGIEDLLTYAERRAEEIAYAN